MNTATDYTATVAEIAALYCPATPNATDAEIAAMVRADARNTGIDLNVWAALIAIADSIDGARQTLANETIAQWAVGDLQSARTRIASFDKRYPGARPTR